MTTPTDRLARLILFTHWMNVEIIGPDQKLRKRTINDWWDACESERARREHSGEQFKWSPRKLTS